jgi:hypothetical protein
MTSFVKALLFITCLVGSARAAGPTHAIVRSESKSIKATLTVEIETPDLETAEWVFFVAQPPFHPSQSMKKIELRPKGVEMRDLSALKRPVVRAQVSTKGKKPLTHRLNVKAQFEGTLFARRLVLREPGKSYGRVDELTPANRELSLASSPIYDFESEKFTAWLDERQLRRRANETELDFARRAFLSIKGAFTYEYEVEMNRAASHVCEVGKSDCGGLSVLFASAMRANGLPARALAGCWAKSAEPGKLAGGVQYNQVHVKAEVYLTDIGWLPVDLASAISHDRSRDGLFFFGNDKGDFLTMHVDPELKVDSIFFGEKTFPWLQQYHFYAAGQGKLTNVKQTVGWKVE